MTLCSMANYQLQCTKWGFRSYSCIDAVHDKAKRFFLGVGKYTPNDVVLETHFSTSVDRCLFGFVKISNNG